MKKLSMKRVLLLSIILLFSTPVIYAQITKSITLRATKSYHPENIHDDAVTLPVPAAFIIPSELPVIAGEAGEHNAILEFRDNHGELVQLHYKGRERRHERDEKVNDVYYFEKSSHHKYEAGKAAIASYFNLRIINGNSSAGKTVVETTLSLNLQYGVKRCSNGGPVSLFFYSDTPLSSVIWSWSGGNTSSSFFSGAAPFLYRSSASTPSYVGPYTVTATFTNGTTFTKTLTSIYEVTTTPPVVNAGTNQTKTVCASSYTFNISGTVSGTPGTGSWSSPTAGTFGNANSLSTTYTLSATDISNGGVTLTLSSTGYQCNATSQVTLTVPKVATVNAGPDQNICANSVTLNGTRGGGSTGAVWSGGAGTFSPNASTLNAVYTPTTSEKTAGSVTLTLTATGSPCGNVSDQVVINLATPPTVNAGPDQTAVDCNSNMFTLSGSVTTPATGGIWSGGSGTFTPNNTSLNAVYTLSAAEINVGSVTLTLSTTGGACVSTNDQVVLKSKNIKPIWATFFGGSGNDEITAIDVDPVSHDIVVAGRTDGTSQTLPITGGTVIRSFGTMGMANDAFAARISADGNTVRWITYIGGTDEDGSDGIRFDAAGNIYWTGTTESLNFPTTVTGYPSDNVGETPFVCRMNGDGSLAWVGAYMQGFEAYADGITVTDDNHVIGGTIFITGSYDTQISCRQNDLFALRINKVTGQQIWMSFFGGPNIDCPGDNGNCIVHDALGNIYIGGSSYGDASDGSIDLTCAPNPTPSLNFAAKEAPGLFYTNNTHTGPVGQYADAIGVKFDANGTLLSWQQTGSMLHDSHIGVGLMPNGDVVFVGYYNSVYNPASILLTRSNANLSGIEKQVIHGNVNELGLGLSIDAQGKVYIVGLTMSTDLYSQFGSPAAYRTNITGGLDMFMARLQVQGGNLKADWFSYYGSNPSVSGTPGDETGLAIGADADGSFYAVGTTNSDNFEWIASPIQPIGTKFTGPSLPPDAAIIKFTCNGSNSSTCSGCRTGFADSQDENNATSIISTSSFVQIYPNPFTNELNILVNGKDEKYSIEITDTKGILVYSKDYVMANIVNVVGDKLSSGVYILKVISEKETVTTKLIKTE